MRFEKTDFRAYLHGAFRLLIIVSGLLAAAAEGAENRRSFLVVSDEEANPGEHPVSEVSILNPHRAVALLSNLTPGKPYAGRFLLQDASGTIVFSNSISFTPTEPDWRISEPYQPDYKSQKPGRWKWSFEIKDGERLTASMAVLPATPSQMAELARHEKAAEEAFRALANYWLAVGDQFFTKLKIEQIQNELVRTTNRVVEYTNQRVPPVFAGQPHPPDKVITNVTTTRTETMVSTTNIIVSFIQARGLDYHFSRSALSEVDTLNGITYRGTASFWYRTYRIYCTTNGSWSDWGEVVHYPHPLLGSVSAALGVPRFLHKESDKIEITERDGNWTVTTSRGDRFVNGKRIDRPNPFAPEPPSAEEARFLLDVAQNRGRLSEKAVGDSIRDHPEILERGILDTMKQLRGRPLVQ